METVLGIDVSGYQDPERVDYAELKRQGFGFVVVKIDQYLTEEHVRLARAAGLEVGGYYWNDPLSAPEYQARRILAEVERLRLRFAALDVEQFWRDWVAYWQWCAKKITLDQVPKFTAKQISDNALVVMSLVKKEIKVPWLLYSAEWFLQGWSPVMKTWLSNFQSWVAQYDHIYSDNHVTWEQLAGLPSCAVLRPLAGSTAKIWQISGSFIYPGRAWWDAYDTDLFLGSAAELQEWLGAVPPAPGFIPYQVTTTATLGLRVRATPVVQPGNIIGKLWPWSPPVTIVEEQGGWGRFCGGWISLSWTRRV